MNKQFHISKFIGTAWEQNITFIFSKIYGVCSYGSKPIICFCSGGSCPVAVLQIVEDSVPGNVCQVAFVEGDNCAGGGFSFVAVVLGFKWQLSGRQLSDNCLGKCETKLILVLVKRCSSTTLINNYPLAYKTKE